MLLSRDSQEARRRNRAFGADLDVGKQMIQPLFENLFGEACL